MKDLLQHIKRLLIDNECVIIPGFGGFITYYASAQFLNDEHLFIPPHRTVGFNPLLQMNDGLLIQSYMQEYEVSYPVALRMVEKAVEELCGKLNQDGRIYLEGLGELSLNIEKVIDFRPEEKGIISPQLYGWGSFEMKELKDIKHSINVDNNSIFQKETKEKKHNILVININKTWLNNAVAVAAAVIMFFMLSTPVANTYVEPESYASLGSTGWFEQIRNRSFATTIVNDVQVPLQKKKQVPKLIHEEKIILTNKNVSEAKPSIDVKKIVVEKSVKQSETKQSPDVTSKETSPKVVPVPNKKQYHIIVASVKNRADAEKTIKDFENKGYPGATVIESDGRVRVALISGFNKEELDNQVLQLRKKDIFKNAWILTTHP